jgi:hypothetical protein
MVALSAMINGLYDSLLDERVSAELAALIEANQVNVKALPAEERSRARSSRS